MQLPLSHVALSQGKHTLVQQNVFQCMFVRAKCWYFLWNRTQGKHFYCLKASNCFYLLPTPFFVVLTGLNRMMAMGKNHCIGHTDGSSMLCECLFHIPKRRNTQQEHREAPMAETGTWSIERPATPRSNFEEKRKLSSLSVVQSSFLPKVSVSLQSVLWFSSSEMMVMRFWRPKR